MTTITGLHKVSDGTKKAIEKLQELIANSSIPSNLIDWSSGFKSLDAEFTKLLADVQHGNKGMSDLEKYMESATVTTSSFASSLKSIALNLGANLLITAAIYGAIKAFDHFNVTVEEQQEKVDGLNEKISTLKTEYDELSDKGNLTDQEKTRLEMLQRQLDVQNELYKIEMKRLAEKDLHGTGDIFSDGNLADLNVEMGYGTVVGGYRREVKESLAELERARSLVERPRSQWTNNHTRQEQTAVENLESQREALLEQYQAYADSYELIKKYMDEGAWDGDSAEKEKYEGLMEQYQSAMDELQAMADKVDIALGLKIDIEPAKNSLREALKDKEGFSKEWLESLSEEEISLLYRLEDVGDKSFEEVNALI